MNQILVTKINKKYKKIFKFQFVFSIIIIFILILYIVFTNIKEKELENISSILNKNIELSKIYNIEKQGIKEKTYFGKIIIEKINLEYLVFNNFSEELLKIAPCKFYGGEIGSSGNICIAGHNYNDKRFFGKLNKLEIDDKIKIVDLEEKEYEYTVYKIFETDEKNVTDVIRKKQEYELTLLTCNNSNKKRIIIKAFRKK